MRQNCLNVSFLVVISWTLGAEASDPVPTQAGSRNVQHSLLKIEARFFSSVFSPHGFETLTYSNLINIIEFELRTAEAEHCSL